MNKYEIVRKIENFAPVDSAEPWDCVGFISETQKQEIKKLMLCLTPTENIIKQAVENECDMIVSHHPMFFVGFYPELVSELSAPKLDIYSAHTNLDKANGGTTDTVIQTLGLKDKQVQIEHEFLRFVEFENGITVEDFSKIVSKSFPNARIVNNRNFRTLHRIAFCAGSGSEFIQEAKNLGADCLVTGDLKFHTALDSEIAVYDIGHFESEILVLQVFKNLIGEDVEIIFAKETSPFKNICCQNL